MTKRNLTARLNGSVSAIALAVSASLLIGSVVANNAMAADTSVTTSIVVPAVPGNITLLIGAQLTDDNNQVNIGNLTAPVATSSIVEGTTGAPSTPVSLIFTDNTILATAVGNPVTVAVGAVDLADLANGFDPDGAAIASGQLFARETAVTGTSVNNSFIEAIVGFTNEPPITMTGNRITASVQGNEADLQIAGDLTAGFTSTTDGDYEFDATLPTATTNADGTLAINSNQTTVGLANAGNMASVTGGGTVALPTTHIRLRVAGATAMDGTVTFDDNQIDSSVGGNTADLGIAIGGGSTNAFTGSVVVGGQQFNTGADASALTDDAMIVFEMGTAATGTTNNGVLSGGTVTVDGNALLSVAQGNNQSIGISSDANVGLTASNSGSATTREVDLDNLTADQVSDVIGATIQVNDNSDFAAAIAGNSRIIARFGTLTDDGNLSVQGNDIIAQAEGNRASTGIAFEGPAFGASVSAMTVQANLDGSLTATNIGGDGRTTDPDGSPSEVLVFFGGGATSQIDGVLALDDNTVAAQARGNIASTGVSIAPAGAITSATGDSAEAFIDDGTLSLSAEGDVVSQTAQYNENNDFLATVENGRVRLLANTAVDGAVAGTVSVDGNAVVAEARGNLNASAVTAEAGTSLAASASNSVLQGNDGIAVTATLGGEFNVIDARLGHETITGSTVSLDGNTIAAQAIGNQSAASISQTAGTDITGDTGSADLTTTANASGGAALVNVQGTVDGTISAVADIDAEARVQLALGDSPAASTVTSSTLSLSDNALVAEARSNRATNTIAMDAGTSLTSGAGLASDQQTLDTTINAELNNAGVAITGAADQTTNPSGSGSLAFDSVVDITGSTVTVDGNQVAAVATGNSVTNAITAEAGVSILGGTVNAVADYTGATTGRFALANNQYLEGGSVDASADNGLVTIDLADVTNTAISLSGNMVLAEARGNQAGNSVTLGSLADPNGVQLSTTAAIGNHQQQYGVAVNADMVSALVELAVIDVTASAFTVDGNVLGGAASGNTASNVISAATGVSIPEIVAGDAIASLAPGGESATAQFAIASRQAVGFADMNTDVDGADVSVTLGDILGAGASLSVSDNTALAEARGNSVTNIAQLGTAVEPIGTSVGSSVAIASEQSALDMDIDANMDSGSVSATMDDITTATITMDGNLIGAVASGSTAGNGINVFAGTSIAAGSGTANAISGPLASDAGFAIANYQAAGVLTNDWETDLSATVTGGAVTLTFGDVTGAGTVSLSDNASLAQAQGNSETSSIVLNAGTSVNATAAIADYQTAYGSVASDNTGSVITVTGDAVDVGTVAVDGNAIGASSGVNSATNQILVDAAGIDVDAGGALADMSVGSNDTSGSFVISDRQFAGLEGALSTFDAESSVSDGEISISLASVLEQATLNVEANTIAATTRGNQNSNLIDLASSLNIDAAAGINSYQLQGGSLEASNASSNIEVSVSPGGILAGTVDVNDNGIGASVIANSSTNRILASAGTSLELDAGGTASSDADAVLINRNASADFAILSQQDSRPGALSLGQAATAVVSNGLIRTTVTGITGEGVLNVLDNTINASAAFNIAGNELDLSAGTSLVSSGAITNIQYGELAADTNHGALNSVGTIAIDAGVVTGGTVTVEGNQIGSITGGNSAVNILSAASGTGISSTGALGQAVIDQDGDALVDADFVIQSNQQLVNDGDASSLSAETTNALVSIIAELTEGTMSVSGNAISASAQGNDATSSLSLNAGTETEASAAVANVQVVGEDLPISASVGAADMTVLNTGTGTIGTMALNDNRITAVAGANRSTNVVSVEAATNIEGTGISALSDGDDVTADFAVLNHQTSLSNVTTSINEATMNLNNGSMASGTTSVQGNQILAQATGNSSTNLISLSGGVANSASMAVSNSQFNTGDITANVTGASITATVAGGTSVVSGNVIGAQAVGNASTSKLTGGL